MKKLTKIVIFLILSFTTVTSYCQSTDPCDQGNQEGTFGGEIIKAADEILQKLNDFVAQIQAAMDPNEIIGPEGYSQRRMISSETKMPYTILFENDPDFATAAAQVVQVRQRIAPFTDASTFEIGNFGFGNFVFEVPPGLNHYQTRLDLRDSLNIYLNVTAGIDIINEELFWVFESLDPETGQLPMDPNTGFLPVNDTLMHNGEGFVNYTIKPHYNVYTGDSITAKASIIFDINAPIETNTTFNILDASAPESQLSAEYNIVNDSLLISWTAKDDPNGSGVAYVDIYGSNAEGDYLIFEHQATVSPVKIPFNSKKDYRFFSIATDNVGNKEAIKALPDVRILNAEKNHAPFLIQPFKDIVLLKNTPNAIVVQEVSSHFIDEDNEVLSYTVSAWDGLDSIKIVNQELVVFPAKDFVNNILIEISATDPSGEKASGTMMLSFRDINSAPEMIHALKDTTVIAGNRLTYVIPEYTFRDTDPDDELSYTVTLLNGQALPAWLTFFANDMLLSGTPTIADIGTYTITVTATDPFNLSANDQFVIKVEDVASKVETTTANNSIKVYPNPVRDFLRIHFTQPLNEAVQISIVDLSGKIIFKRKLTDQESVINVSALLQGTYVIIFEDKKERFVERFIKF